MDLVEIGWGAMDWFGLAENRDRWRALVNVVMSLWVPGNYRVATQLVAPQVVFSSIELVILFIYGAGVELTIYWPILPALDDRW
jgi:hypothetical protein